MPVKKLFKILFIIAIIAIAGWYYKAFKTVPALPAYQVDLINEQNQPVKISDFKGQHILISYFQTWCVDCLKELPSIEILQKKIGKEKLKVLLVTDEDQTKINHYKEHYCVTLDCYRTEKSLAQQKIRIFPTTYLLDENGKVIMSKIQAFDWSSDEVIKKCNE